MKDKLFYTFKIIYFLSLLTLSICVSAQTNSDKKVKTNISSQANKPVKILKKPRASYPKPDTGTICAQGTVSLRVTFLASGKIGKISIVSGLPYGLSEKAVEAAEKIEFVPALKDELPVTVTKTVIYNFAIY